MTRTGTTARQRPATARRLPLLAAGAVVALLCACGAGAADAATVDGTATAGSPGTATGTTTTTTTATGTATTSTSTSATSPTSSGTGTGSDTNTGTGTTTAAAAAATLPTRLYVDPTNAATAYATAHPDDADATVLARLGRTATSTWLTGGSTSLTTLSRVMKQSKAQNRTPVVVVYDLPRRDCGSYSAGGATTAKAYKAYVAAVARRIGSKPALVVLEPDGTGVTSCLDSAELKQRLSLLSHAVTTLGKGRRTRVYVDAGNPGMATAAAMAALLRSAGVAKADGFALNVSNFYTTAEVKTYGTALSKRLKNKHYVIDTSRNGNGPTSDHQWCNPTGRALGATPSLTATTGRVDARLWIKTPWESDGTCNGGPGAGVTDLDYAVALARAAGW